MTVNVYQSLFEVSIPAAVGPTPPQEPPKSTHLPLRQPSLRAAAMMATGLSFVVPAPADIRSSADYGWPVQSPQPSRQRCIALIPTCLHDTTPQISFPPHGWAEPYQRPEAFRRRQAFFEISWWLHQQSAVSIPLSWGFGIGSSPTLRPYQCHATSRLSGPANVNALFGFRPHGWETGSLQLPHPGTDKSGAVQLGESGIAAPPTPFSSCGWTTGSVQPSVLGCNPVFSDDGWRLDQASVAAVPLNWGFEPFLPLLRRQNELSMTYPGSKIAVAPPVITTPNDTVRPERLLSSSGRVRLLATSGKVRILQA